MKAGFLFKKKDTAGNGLIYLALYFKDETELISTGQRIHREKWDSSKQFPKEHSGEIAREITQVKANVYKAITRLQAREEIVTPFAVKIEYRLTESKRISAQLTEDKKEKISQGTVSFSVNQWLENSLFKYANSTKRSIQESLNQFLEFLRKADRGSTSIKELDRGLITAYERYLQDKKKLSNSTHGKRMKHLRWFLKSINYDVSSIKIRNHRKDIIALSTNELKALEEIDVSSSSEHQRAKDLFLLGCYTGLRISDLKKINQTRLIDGKICMNLQKNKKEVTIPIVQESRLILERYGNKSPKITHLNSVIKEVCERAGITELVTVKKNVAGKDVEKTLPKYKLISSHAASKTFITLAPEKYGMTPAEIAAIVGKDLKTLLNHYFKLPRESAIKKMMKPLLTTT